VFGAGRGKSRQVFLRGGGESSTMRDMAQPLNIVLAQVNPLVGDIPGNTRRVLAIYRDAIAKAMDVVVFPELVLTGYPPEDLLLRPDLSRRIERALAQCCAATGKQTTAMVIGYPARRDGELYNCAGVIANGTLLAEYRKQCLPNYRVFDEKRYFAAGNAACVFDLKGSRCALTICEDIWFPEPMQQAKAAGAQLMLNINASPYHVGKQAEREQLIAMRAREGKMPVVYVNPVGGQDELVFDGGSMVVDAQGMLMARAPAFDETLLNVTLTANIPAASIHDALPVTASIYHALVTGVRDYVTKNKFRGVVLGLSGGIDSALTLAIAVDALGADHVEAVMMPFHYTASMSVEDAADEAKRLGVRYRNISIASMVEASLQSLSQEFAGLLADKTEENIQARCRGLLLMAISNKKGYLVLTTGNKSEMAVGYCTLYGDMVGGFAVLKDVTKTRVYELANYRNTISAVIPQRVIDRAPSAELAPNQKDQDSLPPYEILDQILELYVEQDCSLREIVAKGFDEATVRRVICMIDFNEYKRRQAPVGVRITQRGFGRDRRYPITSGWEVDD
jgi:NAD+ synthase (glutamine-hydrolysing)